jgi:hypothetical protein
MVFTFVGLSLNLRDIAAFGGLILGSINLFITIYEKFIRKPQLKIDIENFAIVDVHNNRMIDLKLDIIAMPHNGDIYLKKVHLINKCTNKIPCSLLRYHIAEVNGEGWQIRFEPPIPSIPLRKAIKGNSEIFDVDISHLRQFQLDRWWGRVPLENFEKNLMGLRINKDSVLPLSFICRLEMIESSEFQWSNLLSKSKWYIYVEYNKNNRLKKMLS